MVKETIESIKYNITEKFTNPFLGSFIIVWIVHHWSIVYAFFYFDKDYSLEKRIQFFEMYWVNHSFLGSLFGAAGIALLVIIFTFLFLAATKYLSNIYRNVLIPLADKYSKGNVVTNVTYQIAIDKIKELDKKIEEERRQKNTLISERDEFERRLYQDRTGGSNITTTVNSQRSDSRFADMKNVLLEIKNPETPESLIDSFIETVLKEESVYRNSSEFNRLSGLPIEETTSFLKYLEEMGFLESRHGKGDIIRYRALKTPILIYSAKYGIGQQEVDVTNKIRELVKMEIFQGQVSPSFLGVADPVPGVPKALKIHCRIRGIERTLDVSDGEIFQIR
jgi:hypothetical protein